MFDKLQYQREWRKANAEKVRAYKKHYYEAHKETVLAEKKRYREKYKEQLHQKRKEFRQQNLSTMLYRELKQRAKARNIEFNITPEDIYIPEVCPILGIPLEYIPGKGQSNNSPSVDRVDNTKGYIQGNIKVISKLANMMKNSANKEQLLMFAKNIQTYLETK